MEPLLESGREGVSNRKAIACQVRVTLKRELERKKEKKWLNGTGEASVRR